MAIGDLDGNGTNDLAVANRFSNNVSVSLSLCPPGCSADLDGSGDVGLEDLLEVIGSWGSCIDCLQDLDGDDFVTHFERRKISGTPRFHINHIIVRFVSRSIRRLSGRSL